MQKIFGEFWSLCQRLENKEDNWSKIELKTESIRKLSNFYFQWTKTLFQNNFNHSAFFFTLFECYKCHNLYEITPKKKFLWELSPSKQTSKASNFTKWNLAHDDFTPVFSIPLKFEIYFSGSHKNLFFGVISYSLLHL